MHVLRSLAESSCCVAVNCSIMLWGIGHWADPTGRRNTGLFAIMVDARQALRRVSSSRGSSGQRAPDPRDGRVRRPTGMPGPGGRVPHVTAAGGFRDRWPGNSNGDGSGGSSRPGLPALPPSTPATAGLQRSGADHQHGPGLDRAAPSWAGRWCSSPTLGRGIVASHGRPTRAG